MNDHFLRIVESILRSCDYYLQGKGNIIDLQNIVLGNLDAMDYDQQNELAPFFYNFVETLEDIQVGYSSNEEMTRAKKEITRFKNFLEEYLDRRSL